MKIVKKDSLPIAIRMVLMVEQLSADFIEKFSGSGAEFIWSTNVILDNEVIIRYTVK
ncbi:hypothetical protein [Bizionia arctica]|uniref:Uncharacterized protein n=1 Tax=Bizionia arctica TaxID=1495645 RepID=A0A917GHA5_9FLAO|nr:hypothetical protein [Bizionia arctica]GGG46085.1 hypothetical protein GCM10010976_17070 [Bizionia arctica]